MSQTDILDRPLNQHGRPDNWADRTVEELVTAFAAGRDAAQRKWEEIIKRDQPRQVDAIVAMGRFHQQIKAA